MLAKLAALQLDVSGLRWVGGILTSLSVYDSGNDKITFDFWIPGMDTSRTCTLAPLQANELLGSYRISLGATTAAQPVMAIAYSAITEASGLTPRQLHSYLQTVSSSSCSLGNRIE